MPGILHDFPIQAPAHAVFEAISTLRRTGPLVDQDCRGSTCLRRNELVIAMASNAFAQWGERDAVAISEILLNPNRDCARVYPRSMNTIPNPSICLSLPPSMDPRGICPAPYRPTAGDRVPRAHACRWWSRCGAQHGVLRGPREGSEPFGSQGGARAAPLARINHLQEYVEVAPALTA